MHAFQNSRPVVRERLSEACTLPFVVLKRSIFANAEKYIVQHIYSVIYYSKRIS